MILFHVGLKTILQVTAEQPTIKIISLFKNTTLKEKRITDPLDLRTFLNRF